MNHPPRIALTPGEPAGIGPDLAVMIASTHADLAPVVITDPALLSERADILDRHLRIRSVGPGNDKLPVPESNTLDVLPVPRPAATICCEPDPANAEYVLETLRIAADGCMKGRFSAMVTGPVNKAIINGAGIPFTGHTEFLAEADPHLRRSRHGAGNLRYGQGEPGQPARGAGSRGRPGRK